MASVCAVLQPYVAECFQWDVVEFIFDLILKIFRMTIEDFIKFSIASLPHKDKFPKKLFALHVCNCNENSKRHFVVKQVTDNENIFVINFSNMNPEICRSNDVNNRILTHILISLIRTRESYWINSTASANKKIHVIAAKLSSFIVDEPSISISSDSEKENSPLKKSLKRAKKSFLEENKKFKRIKSAPIKQRDFSVLCKAGMFNYNEEKEALIQYLQTLPFTIDKDFLEADSKVLSKKVAELFTVKAQQDSDDALQGTSGSKTGELEALFRSFQAAKSIAIENISKSKKSAENELVQFKEREEKERAANELAERLETERLEAERVEAERVEAEREEAERVEAERRETAEIDMIEEAIRSITAAHHVDEPAQAEPCTADEPARVVVEEGEISELERVRRYYCKAVKVAATYAAALEQYAPALRLQCNYSLQELKAKRANCRTAMTANDDTITSVIHREKIGTWHGPGIPLPPTDLPDFYKVERVQSEMRSRYFNN